MMTRLEYLFSLVNEEGCEIGQAANKCNRFTPHHAYYEKSNLERLQVEITDLMTVLTMIEEELKFNFDFAPSDAKRQRIENYMEISRNMGTLEPFKGY